MTGLQPVTVEVPTPQGPGRWLLSPSPATPARALLLVGHGAGGGLDGVDLVALAEHLPSHGITVARFDQPWHVAGRKIATRPPTLDAAWLAGAEHLVAGDALGLAGLPVFAAGHSAGARVACRTAAQVGAAGVVALSFPLHPPGKPERSRIAELLTPTVPVLVIQGDRDPFGSADEVRAAVAATAQDRATQDRGSAPIEVTEVTGAAHTLGVPAKVRSAAEHRRHLADLVLSFLDRLG